MFESLYLEQPTAAAHTARMVMARPSAARPPPLLLRACAASSLLFWHLLMWRAPTVDGLSWTRGDRLSIPPQRAAARCSPRTLLLR